jgi:hypothetical protein
VDTFGQRLHATLPAASPERAQELADRLAADLREGGIDVYSSRPSTPSLEDVFISRIRARQAPTGAAEVSP